MTKFLKEVKEYARDLTRVEDCTHLMLIPCRKAYYLSDMCEIWVLNRNKTISIFEGSSMIFITKESFSGKLSDYDFDKEYIGEMRAKYGYLKD